MKEYTLVNWSSGEIVTIKALYIENERGCWQLGIYDEANNKLMTSAYNSRYWDIRNIKPLDK